MYLIRILEKELIDKCYEPFDIQAAYHKKEKKNFGRNHIRKKTFITMVTYFFMPNLQKVSKAHSEFAVF